MTAAEVDLAQAAKRFATLQAQCALHGFQLSRQHDGTYWVGRWGHGRPLPDEDAVRAWLVRATGKPVQ